MSRFIGRDVKLPVPAFSTAKVATWMQNGLPHNEDWRHASHVRDMDVQGSDSCIFVAYIDLCTM